MNRTTWASIGAILCFSSLAIAYFYFQLDQGLPPCPLCILDRIIIGILGVVFLIMMLNVYFLTRLLGWLALLAGFAVGGRHVWLERFRDPSDAGDCAPGGAQSAIEWLTSAFIGTVIAVSYIGSIGGWVLLTWLLFFILCWLWYLGIAAKELVINATYLAKQQV